MKIKRDIFKRVKKELKRKQITALIGSRQVGKTTILKEIYKDLDEAIFMSFEDLDYLRQFDENIKLFAKQYVESNKYVFIDEFQYSKNGGKNLKYIYDTYENVKIFISGSSSSELAIQSLQYLVGRVNIIEIFPLTFKEFINFKSKNKTILFEERRKQNDLVQLNEEFEEYLQYGGYPQVVLEEDLELKAETLKDIVQTYLLKEIKDILEYKNIFEYENLLKRLALQDSKLLNKSTFSQDLGINRNKIDEMINILDKTYIISILRPFLKNKIKEQIKSPKTFMQDFGFKNVIINNFNQLELRADKGEIYENFVLNQLIRQKKELRFFNIDNVLEMDFVYEEGGEIFGIEIKSKLKNDSLTKSMKKFIDLYNPKIVYVFCENLDSEIEYNNTKIIFTNYINCTQL